MLIILQCAHHLSFVIILRVTLAQISNTRNHRDERIQGALTEVKQHLDPRYFSPAAHVGTGEIYTHDHNTPRYEREANDTIWSPVAGMATFRLAYLKGKKSVFKREGWPLLRCRSLLVIYMPPPQPSMAIHPLNVERH